MPGRPSRHPQPQAATDPRHIDVTLKVELSHRQPIEFLNSTVAKWLRDNAERPDVPYRIVEDTIRVNPALMATIRVGDDYQEVADKTHIVDSRPSQITPPPAPQVQDGGGGMSMRGQGEKVTLPGASGAAADPTGINRPPAQPRPGERPKPPGALGGDNRGGGGEDQPLPGLTVPIGELAPPPPKPRIYPPNSQYYVATITFTVELLDPNAEHTPEQTASANGTETSS